MPGGQQTGCHAEQASGFCLLTGSVKKASRSNLVPSQVSHALWEQVGLWRKEQSVCGVCVCVVGGGGDSRNRTTSLFALRLPERVFRFQATLLNTEAIHLRISCYLGS